MLSPAVCICTSGIFPCRQLKCMLDFRLSLERVLFLAVDPVCSLAQLTTLTLKPSQKGMRALSGGGAAEELPKMGRQPEASPARTVTPHNPPLYVVRVGLHPTRQLLICMVQWFTILCCTACCMGHLVCLILRMQCAVSLHCC